MRASVKPGGIGGEKIVKAAYPLTRQAALAHPPWHQPSAAQLVQLGGSSNSITICRERNLGQDLGGNLTKTGAFLWK